MRVKSQIGTSNAYLQNNKLLNKYNETMSFHNESSINQPLPSKFQISKERRVGNSQEARLHAPATRSARDKSNHINQIANATKFAHGNNQLVVKSNQLNLGSFI